MSLVQAYQTRAAVLAELGRLPEAEETARQQLAVYGRFLAGPDVNQEIQLDWLGARRSFASLLDKRSKAEEAKQVLRETITHLEDLAGKGEPRWRLELARAQHGLARVLAEEGDFAAAAELCDAAIRAATSGAEGDPLSEEWQALLYGSHVMLVNAHLNLGDRRQAEAHQRRATQIAEQVHGVHGQWLQALAVAVRAEILQVSGKAAAIEISGRAVEMALDLPLRDAGDRHVAQIIASAHLRSAEQSIERGQLVLGAHRSAVGLLEGVHAEAPEDPTTIALLEPAYEALVFLLRFAGDKRGARRAKHRLKRLRRARTET